MSDPVRDELLERFAHTDDPVVLERTRRMVRIFLRHDAELRRQIMDYVLEAERDEGRMEGERVALMLVLSRRGLTPTADQRTCIDACTEPATIERWIGQAVTAASVDEALR